MKTASLMISLLAAAGLTLPVLAQDLVEMQTTLPKPVFEGTPVPIKLPNLEKPLGKPRPPFMVPQGTVNVALNKPVTASDDLPIIGEIEFLTDGDKEGTDGSYVELGPGVQWIQVDLEARYKIHALLFWHFHSNPRVYHDVVVQVSDDPEFKEGVTTVYNNDHDNSSKLGQGKELAYIETSEGRLVDAKGVVGRYVRLYSRGNTANDMNHYVELEVHGQPAE